MKQKNDAESLKWAAVMVLGFTGGYALGRYPWEAATVEKWIRMLMQVVLGSVVAYTFLVKRNKLVESREEKNRLRLADSIRLFVSGQLFQLEQNLRAMESLVAQVSPGNTGSFDAMVSTHLNHIKSDVEMMHSSGVISESARKALETGDSELVSDIVGFQRELERWYQRKDQITLSENVQVLVQDLDGLLRSTVNLTEY